MERDFLMSHTENGCLDGDTFVHLTSKWTRPCPCFSERSPVGFHPLLARILLN